jgi:PAS domain S-box-containing protein
MTRILIVEDEQVVAWHIQEALEKLGYSVIGTVASGAKAIEVAGAERPNLVLMDIRLKGKVDGITAAEEIYSQCEIPIIYLTAHTDETTLQRATRTAPFGYLVKPLRSQELKTTIEVTLHRYQIEQATKQTQRWLSTTLSSIGDATVATNLDGMITFMNPAAEALTGWSRQEAMGLPISTVLNLIREDSREAIENPLLEAMREGMVIKLSDRTMLRAKDGVERAVGDSAAPIRNEQGTIIGGVLVFQDVTDRRQAEMVAQQQQESLIDELQQRTTQLQQALSCTQLLRLFVEQVQDSTDEAQVLNLLVEQLGRSLDAYYCWASTHNAQQITATITSEYRGIDPQGNGDAIHPSALGTQIELSSAPRFYFAVLQREPLVGPPSDQMPLPYQLLIAPHCQLLILPFFDGQRVIGEIGALVRDQPTHTVYQVELLAQVLSQCAILLREKRLSQVAQSRSGEMELLNYLKQDFLSAISHELRTPLTNMRMAMEMLRRITLALKTNTGMDNLGNSHEVLIQKLEHYVQLLQSEWQQEFEQINDLLSFQELEPGEALTLNSINLLQWIPQVVSPFMVQAAQKRQWLNYEVSPEIPVLLCHAPSLKRIVEELLRNAFKHSPANQEVVLTASTENNQLRIAVTSYGVTLSNEECTLIFEPFYRVIREDRWRQTGTGLGLPLSKRLARRINGDILVESQNSVTTFTVLLPLVQ